MNSAGGLGQCESLQEVGPISGTKCSYFMFQEFTRCDNSDALTFDLDAEGCAREALSRDQPFFSHRSDRDRCEIPNDSSACEDDVINLNTAWNVYYQMCVSPTLEP